MHWSFAVTHISLPSNFAIKKAGELMRIELNEIDSNIVSILVCIDAIRLKHQCNQGEFVYLCST